DLTQAGISSTGGGLSDTDTVTFTPLSRAVNFDYDGNGVVDANDAATLEANVVRLVTRYYEFFDVSIQTARATSTTDVLNSLARNGSDPTGHNDASVLVTPVASSTAITTGLFGIAAGADIGVANNRDDSAVVFANNLFGAGNNNASADTAMAYTAAH